MRKIFSVLFALVMILSNSNAFAAEQLIEASGEYVMDSRLDETPASATNRAREEAKRAAVEKAGTYLQSYSKMINFELDTDIVQTVAARLLKIQDESSDVEIIEKNLLKFKVTIKALVNEVSDEDLKKIMQDKESLEELTRKNKEIQEKYDALKAEMEKYRNAYDTASDAQKAEIKREVARNSENFSAVEAMARGNEFSFNKNYGQALVAYTEAIKLNPQLAEAYNNRGIVKYELGQYSSAIEDYTTAINLKPNFADALNNRGNAYFAMEQFQNAAQDLQTAVKLQDNSAVIHNNLGSVYLSLKNYDAAIKEYTRALQLEPNYAEAYYNRSIAYYAQGNFNQAMADVKSSLALNPNDLEAQAFYKQINSKVG